MSEASLSSYNDILDTFIPHWPLSILIWILPLPTHPRQELTQLLPKHVEPLIDLMGHDEGEGEGYHSANISILESKLFEMASTIGKLNDI